MVVGPRELATVTRRDKWQPLAAMRVAQLNEPFSQDMRPIGKHLPIQHGEKGRIVRGRSDSPGPSCAGPEPRPRGPPHPTASQGSTRRGSPASGGVRPVPFLQHKPNSTRFQKGRARHNRLRRNSKQPNRWRRGSKCHKCANGWSPTASGGAGEIQKNPRRGSCVARRSVQWSCAHQDRAWRRAGGPWHTRN